MPVSKNRRKTGDKTRKRHPIWLSSREYKSLLAKVYLLEHDLLTVRQFLGEMVKSMSKQAAAEEAPPVDTGTPGTEVYDGPEMPVTFKPEETSSAVG